MLAFVLVATCFGTIFGLQYSRESLQAKYPGFGTEWVPMDQKEDGEYIIGYFTSNDLDDGRLSFLPELREAVTFTLYTRDHPNGIKIEDSLKIHEKIFHKTKPTKFVTHGWMSSGDADTCISIKNGFLRKYDANVFIMDWSDISGNVFYPIPMRATKSVGDYYAGFVNQVVDLGVDPEDIHFVGHSLGAHVSGFAARGVNKGKIGRITGLDPALPGFNTIQVVEGGRLNKTDAHFVDVIHTCGGYLGMKASIGHADFYPNGGSVPQPGCDSILEMMEACSHGRSWVYFAESLVSSVPFMAHRCDSFQNFVNEEKCKKEESVPMGDPTPTSTRGDYYLRTEQVAPFAIKDVQDRLNNLVGS